MTALRTTQPTNLRPTRHVLRVLVGFLGLGVFGCGTATPPPNDPTPSTSVAMPGMNDPNWLTSREKLPPPDCERIEYDAQKQTLSLYDLPGRDHWMVQLPDESAGRFVGPQHRLPEGVDTSRTLVYYARAGAKTSVAITVAEIETGRAPHTSRLALR